jgi:hypothetical protein
MPASRQCSHYVVQTAASTLDFDTKSTLHAVHGKASQLSGFLDALCEDGALALDPPPKMHVEFPIERLVSGNGLQDKEMWKLLDSKRNPLIRADLRELQASSGTNYAASGEITMCGRSRKDRRSRSPRTATDAARDGRRSARHRRSSRLQLRRRSRRSAARDVRLADGNPTRRAARAQMRSNAAVVPSF